MNSFYYTFGSDPGYPYQCGWVEVHAASRKDADDLSLCYTAKRWARMDPEHNWPGWKCFEIIR